VFSALFLGLAARITFGFLGALAYSENANLFDDLFFSTTTPPYIIILVFIYTLFVILPVVVRSSLMAKYFIYIGGMCEVPCNIFTGIILPWILGAVVNHLEIYAYLINWTALITHLYVQFVCPMFMWSKTVKEAHVFEVNFRQSLQMMVDGERSGKAAQKADNYDSFNEGKYLREDGIPSIEHSVSGGPKSMRERAISTSKFLLNETTEEDERLSNVTDIVCE